MTNFNFQPSAKPSGVTSKKTPAPKADAECQICFRYGHTAKHCWYRFEEDPSPTFQAFVAQPFTPTHAPNEWVLDTGATNHVIGDINNLSNFYEYTRANSLQIGNGRGLSILHIRSTIFSINSTTLVLQEVLHVPSFTKNLISLSRLLLDNPSLTCEFFSNSCILKDLHTKRNILQITTSKGLYNISPTSTSAPTALLGTRISIDTWHDRLGHPSQDITFNVVKSFSLLCNSNKLTLCHCCCMAKAHQLPFSHSLSTSTFPLELVHSDVWGPTPINSFNGFRYYIIFVDDFSHFTWIYFMFHKSEVTRVFTSFKSQVENLLSSQIKTLRTDDGTKYKPILSQFPQITHQTTCPYTPQQNRLSERKHRHIIKLSLAMMTRASVPMKFWDEMISNAVYLINRLSSSAHSIISFTKQFHKPPDYAFLKVVGCLLFSSDSSIQ
jgi:GAG-pre-integrase domain